MSLELTRFGLQGQMYNHFVEVETLDWAPDPRFYLRLSLNEFKQMSYQHYFPKERKFVLNL